MHPVRNGIRFFKSLIQYGTGLVFEAWETHKKAYHSLDVINFTQFSESN